MSMNQVPCSGFVLSRDEVLEILEKLVAAEPKKYRKYLNEFDNGGLDDPDQNEIELKATAHAFETAGLPVPNWCFMLGNDDYTDDLSYETLYFYFEEEELHVISDTEPLTKLKQLSDKTPKFSRWSVWG